MISVKQIRQKLQDLDKSSSWLAQKVGVQRSTISRILRKERKGRTSTMNRIGAVLNLLDVSTVPVECYQEVVEENLAYQRQIRELQARIERTGVELNRLIQLEIDLKLALSLPIE